MFGCADASEKGSTACRVWTGHRPGLRRSYSMFFLPFIRLPKFRIPMKGCLEGTPARRFSGLVSRIVRILRRTPPTRTHRCSASRSLLSPSLPARCAAPPLCLVCSCLCLSLSLAHARALQGLCPCKADLTDMGDVRICCACMPTDPGWRHRSLLPRRSCLASPCSALPLRRARPWT